MSIGFSSGASCACPGRTSTAIAVDSSAAVTTILLVSPPRLRPSPCRRADSAAPRCFAFRAAPAACRWARTLVESTSTRRTSPNCGSAVISSNSRARAPEATQRRNRLYTASQAPNSPGRSRSGMPVRAMYRVASKNIRSGSTGGWPPLCRLAWLTSGSIAAHSPSVIMYRMGSVAPGASHRLT